MMPMPTLNIGGLLEPLLKAAKEQLQRQEFSAMGQALTSDSPDFKSAAAQMFASGRPEYALKLIELGQAHRKQQLGEEASREFGAALGGMLGGASSPTPAPTAERFDPTKIPSFVASAGQGYGISPEFMQRTAWIESRGNPQARNPSGASGLFQFMPQTAAQYGLRNPFDPEASANAAARLAADNSASLRSALRRDPTDAELYLAHQQGAGGASALLRNPNASAHAVLTEVYGSPTKAAAAIRQDGGNLDMTAGDFAGLWTGKFNALGSAAPSRGSAPPPARAATMALPAEAAGGGDWITGRVGSEAFSPDGSAQANARVAGGTNPADLPSMGAREAQGFLVPGAPAASPLEARAQLAVEAANKGGLSTRITGLTKLLANPHLPDGQRQLALTFVRDALDQAKVPDGVKEFMWARANGMTEARTPAEYDREKKGPGAAIQEFEYGQMNPAFAQRQLELKRAGAQNINVGGGSDKQIFDTMDESAKAARLAATGLASLREARAAVEGGIVSGAGADMKLTMRRVAAALGADPAKVVNTETFRSAIAPQIATLMKATVGSTQISNSDREFAEKAAGGSISLNEGSIRRLLDIMERANVGVVEEHKRRLEAVYPGSGNFGRERALFGVDAPARPPGAGGLPVGGSRSINGITIQRVQ